MINIARITVLTALTAACLSLAPLTYAQSPTVRPINVLKCDATTTRIDALVIKANVRSQRVTAIDTGVMNWWTNIGKSKFISTYGQSAYDQLNTYFSTLHTTYGVPLTTEAQAYAIDLQKLHDMSKSGDCGTSGGSFVTQLQTVKGERDSLNTDIKNWRDYFENTIKVYVQGLPVLTPTPTPIPSTDSSSNNTTVSAPPVCSDIKPASAPTLISATTVGPNEVQLSWSKASDPVSYYLIAYGIKSGTPIYGNPNVGDNNTTSYTVRNLSGGVTYYFTVRAGNGCTPGDFSNEVSSTPTGPVITNPATGFSTGVLGTSDIQPTVTPSEVPIGRESNIAPRRVGLARIFGPISDFFTSIYNFFASIF